MTNPYTPETIEALAAYFVANTDYTTEQRTDGRTVHIFRPKQPLVAPESLGIVERFNRMTKDEQEQSK